MTMSSAPLSPHLTGIQKSPILSGPVPSIPHAPFGTFKKNPSLLNLLPTIKKSTIFTSPTKEIHLRRQEQTDRSDNSIWETSSTVQCFFKPKNQGQSWNSLGIVKSLETISWHLSKWSKITWRSWMWGMLIYNVENHRCHCANFETIRTTWTQLHGPHNRQCTCVRWETIAKLTFGICHRTWARMSNRLLYWSTRRTNRSRIWHGQYCRRNGWQSASWSNCRF